MTRVVVAVMGWDNQANVDMVTRIQESVGDHCPGFYCEVMTQNFKAHETVVLNQTLNRASALRPDYVWLLTPDMKIENPGGTLKSLVRTMEEEPKCAIVVPNREGEPWDEAARVEVSYLADGTAPLFRAGVVDFYGGDDDPILKYDQNYIFTGWSDLDIGNLAAYRGWQVMIDHRVSVLKNPTPYGSWSNFRAAYNARNRLLLEFKWYDVGIERWQGVEWFNSVSPPERRLPTEYELAWYGEEKLKAYAASVNYEHPPISLKAAGHAGNPNWSWERVGQ